MPPHIRSRARIVVGLLSAAVSSTACLHSAQDLVAGADGRVIVTGLSAGDDVTIEIDGDVKRATAPGDEPLVVYLELSQGDHDGRAIFTREDGDLCAAFVLHVTANAATASVDAAAATLCEASDDAGFAVDAGHDVDAGFPPDDAGLPPPDDAGSPPPDDAGFPPDAGFAPIELLTTLVESVDVLSCLVEPCSITTTVSADGSVAYTALDAATLTGSVQAVDLVATSERARSDPADALFAGDDPSCAQPRPTSLTLDTVTLRRDVDPGTGDPVVSQTVDVTGCDVGIARELRLRLQLLRQVAGLPL